MYDIILFVVSGFLFLGVFRFVTGAERIHTNSSTFLGALIVGFVLKSVFAAIPLRTSIHTLDILLYLLGCVTLGYALAKFYHSNSAIRLFNKLGVRRTSHPYLWNDLTDHEDSLWVKIGYKDLDLQYYGLLTTYEETERYPQIVLSGYTRGTYEQDLTQTSPDTTFLEDHTGKLNHSVLLDTSKADFVEFISTRQEHAQSQKRRRKDKPKQEVSLKESDITKMQGKSFKKDKKDQQN